MREGTGVGSAGEAALVDRVLGAVREQGPSWLPELSPPFHTRLLAMDVRPRCFLLRLAVEDGSTRRDLVVKVRHSRPELRRSDRFPGRRVLAPERTLPDLQAAERELQGLRLIEAAMHPHEGTRFGVLRPLAWLEEVGGIVLHRVDEPTLRDRLLAGSRLSARRGRRWPAAGPCDVPGQDPWRAVGEWLRVYRSTPSDLQLVERLSGRDELPALFHDYARFLGDLDHSRRGLLQRCAGVGVSAVADLPARLELGTSHGDFVSRNVFCSPSGRITVFDPMPLWRVPVYEDLARMLVVGLRMVDTQALSQGLALPVRQLDDHEQALVEGCFGPDRVPWPAVRLFQLLVLLDTWSNFASKRWSGGGVLRSSARAVIRTATEAHFHREARRLLALLEAGGS